MGDLSKNLSRHEVACKCGCGGDTIDYETVNMFQDCCDHFATELGVDRVIADISSGYRCMEHNLRPVSEGGAGSTEGSYHPKGKALDFSIRGISPKKVYEYLDKKYLTKGVGEYGSFTHIDSRNFRARWGRQ